MHGILVELSKLSAWQKEMFRYIKKDTVNIAVCFFTQLPLYL